MFMVKTWLNGTTIILFQGTAVDSLLDYPMYYQLRRAFIWKESMTNLQYGVKNRKTFPDPTVLGTFLDNHDNYRFLSGTSDWTSLKNALAYIVFAEVCIPRGREGGMSAYLSDFLFMQGIPIIYYGTEQGFSGHIGENREPLWPHYDTEHELYMFISTIVKFRVQLGAEVYDVAQVERYVDDEFFAFSRGNVS